MATQASLLAETQFLRYSHTIGVCVMQGRGFMFPVDTLISKDGRMHTISRAYDAVPSQLRVTMYDINSEFYGIYGGGGDGLGQFKWPSAIAADNEGNVFITDQQLDRITIYRADGSPKDTWGISGNRAGELSGPSGIAFDSNNDVFVSDHLNSRVQKFDKGGNFILAFGYGANSEVSLHLPWGLTVDTNNCVYVADWGNHRVNKYSHEGNFIRSFGSQGTGDGQFVNPSSVAVDGDDYMYIADWGNERVQVLDRHGAFVSKLRGEATISKWGQEYLDANYEEAEPRSRSNLEPELLQFDGDPHEESAHTEKFFWGPTSVKLDEAGKLYVTESNRHRVQIYERATRKR